MASPETASTLRELMIDNFLHMFAISFLYYDHLITIGAEVEVIWKRPKGQSSYWFMANRYIPFFGNIAVTVLGYSVELSLKGYVTPTSYETKTWKYNTDTSRSCNRYTLFRQLFLIFNQVFVSVLLTMRIYALYECSKRVLTFTVTCGFVLTVMASLHVMDKSTLFSEKRALTVAGGGCHIGVSSETALRMAGAWEALFVYDSMLFTLTILKTWNAWKVHALTGVRMPILHLILRDGAIYFAVMALCNFANILTFYCAGPFIRGSLSTFSSATTERMSVTMMTRLILNLHQTADEGIFSTRVTSTNMVYATAPLELEDYHQPSEDYPSPISDVDEEAKQEPV